MKRKIIYGIKKCCFDCKYDSGYDKYCPKCGKKLIDAKVIFKEI